MQTTDYNGIICIDKPKDFTSFDVIAKLRGILKMKRIGHAGTLDPMATGVLPVFLGKATRACDIIPCDTKEYLAGFELGKQTDTQDITGNITAVSDKKVTKQELSDAALPFIGEIEQIPPMYSAVKINGQKLYQLARQGVEVERKPRKITVHRLELVEFDEQTQTGQLRILCSRGTYIRTICHDIGEKLGCGGVMTSLVRTASSGFELSDCVTLSQVEQLRDSGSIETVIKPTDTVFKPYPQIKLNQKQSVMYKNGVKLDLERVICDKTSEFHRVYDNEGNFTGIAKADAQQNILKTEKMF